MIRKNGVRCARKHTKDNEYCSSHKKKDAAIPSVAILQEGEKIEGKEGAKTVKQKKEKVKVEKKENPKVDNKEKEKEQANKIIKHEVQIIEVKGIPYYIDNKDNVYKHDTIYMLNPVIIGKINRQDMQIAFKSEPILVSP